MMEKVEEYTVTSTRRTHSFSCDDCGKYLGYTSEWSDGWYEELGEYEQSFFVEDVGWMMLHKTLCDDCAQKMTNKIVDTLKQFGFEED